MSDSAHKAVGNIDFPTALYYNHRADILRTASAHSGVIVSDALTRKDPLVRQRTEVKKKSEKKKKRTGVNV